MATKNEIKNLFDENLRKKFGEAIFSSIVDALYDSPTANANLDILVEYNKKPFGKENKATIALSLTGQMPYGGYENGVPVVYINPSNPLLSELRAKEFAVIIARESGFFNWKMPDDIDERLINISITEYLRIRSQIEGIQTASQVRAEHEMGVTLSIDGERITELKKEFLRGKYTRDNGLIDYEKFGFRYISISNLYNKIINERIVKLLKDFSSLSDLLPQKGVVS